MELKLNISYQELLNVIKSLSPGQIKKLREDILSILSEKEAQGKAGSFQGFLLDGPVMDDAQYDRFLEIRKSFNQWRQS